MSLPIIFTGLHHFSLSVTDLSRSLEFYEKLGFHKIGEFKEKTLVSNNNMIIGLEIAEDTTDKFNPKRVGLDHLSFQVDKVEDLETAVSYFDEVGISHGEITNLSEYGIPILILPFFDPDGIALELTASS